MLPGGISFSRGALFGCIHNTDAAWGSTSGVMMSWIFWNRALIGFTLGILQLYYTTLYSQIMCGFVEKVRVQADLTVVGAPYIRVSFDPGITEAAFRS